MDEIKWSKNETNNSIFNKTYIDTLTNGQKYLPDDIQKDCFDKDNIKACLTEQEQFILPDSKTSNDSNEKLNIGGLDRQAQIQQIVENTISEESRIRIHQILEMVSALSSAEKLLLYLRLPTDNQPIADPLRQPLNPLGSRTEISQTINWIRTHLEEDPQLAMQKQDVYEEYLAYCSENEMKALSTADFGKVMKQVYPRVRPRRLGTRGHSKYCYAGLRKRIKLEPPVLPDLLDFPKSTEIPCSQADLMKAASHLIREWAENLLGMQFPTLESLACHLINIKCVDTRSVAALTVINVFGRNIDKVAKMKDPTIGKHRETQLQLQRKLHQREVIREQKRKLQLQTSKCDTNSSAKRTRKVKTEQNTPSTSPLITEEAADDLVDINNKGAETNLMINNNNNNNINTNSPQTIAQGNNKNSTPGTTLRLIPVCDKKSSSTIQPTTSLPDFSSFQVNNNNSVNINNNNNNNNYSQTLSYNNATPDTTLGGPTASTTTVKSNVNNNNNVAENKKLKSAASCQKNQEKIITVKSFANKSISRSNSCENDQSMVQTLIKIEENANSNSSGVSCTKKLIGPPQLPNITISAKTNPVVVSSHNNTPTLFSSQKPKYKAIPPDQKHNNNTPSGNTIIHTSGGIASNIMRSHDNNNSVVVSLVDSTSSTREQRQMYTTFGYYNQILENSDNKTKLQRERVYSIGNIDKDALDDYLYSGNNSQEPEEEIMQYFHNDSSSVEDFRHTQDTKNLNLIEKSSELIKVEDLAEKCDKISQLRLLLEKNIPNSSSSLSSSSSSISALKSSGVTVAATTTGTDEIGSVTNMNSANNNYPMYHHQTVNLETQNSLILSSLLTSNSGLSAKRRVSFEIVQNNNNNNDSIPPSPNTRRKIFSFTPISPGPNSPGATTNGKQSKNSSTNASPFVSPRNTPVPTKFHTRTRLNQSCPSSSTPTTTISGNNNSNTGNRNKKMTKTQQETNCNNSNDAIKLSIDIEKASATAAAQFVNPNENHNLFLRKSNLPMSAPPSPMLSSYRTKTTLMNPSNYLKTLLDSDVPPTKLYPSNDSTNIDEYIDKKLQSRSTTSTSTSTTNTTTKHNLAKLKIDISSSSSAYALNALNNELSPQQQQQQPLQVHCTTQQNNLTTVHSADPLSQEVSQFFPDDYNNNDNMDNLLFRSQSVPLHQMKSIEDNLASPNSITAATTPSYFNQPGQQTIMNLMNNFNTTSNVTSTCSSVGQTPVPNEFSDFTGTFTGDDNAIINENLDKIINIWQNDSNNIQMNSTDILTNDPEINVLTNFAEAQQETNELIQQLVPPDSSTGGNVTSAAAALMRSQSIDFSGVINQNVKYPSSINYPPSRSVPSTPLPFMKERDYHFTRTDYETSKSHPSTPLLLNDGAVFTYNKNFQISDYLLNGQPISSSNNSTNKLINKMKNNNNILNDTTTTSSSYDVDDNFSFSESVLIDTNETFSSSHGVVGDDNEFAIQLAAAAAAAATTTSTNPSENFVTSTNDQQNLT